MVELPLNYTDISSFLEKEIIFPARENAWVDEYLSKDDKYNETAEFARCVEGNAYSIIDSLNGREYIHYGFDEPISDDLAFQLRAMVKQKFAFLHQQNPISKKRTQKKL